MFECEVYCCKNNNGAGCLLEPEDITITTVAYLGFIGITCNSYERNEEDFEAGHDCPERG